jgi:hypothetical protein
MVSDDKSMGLLSPFPIAAIVADSWSLHHWVIALPLKRSNLSVVSYISS